MTMMTTSKAVMAHAVRHWHVTESTAGYLPESEPYTSDDAASALDDLSHRLADWANAFDDPEDLDAAYAAGVAEHYCTCRTGARSAEHHDAMAAVDDGRGICEQIDGRVFELAPCSEKIVSSTVRSLPAAPWPLSPMSPDAGRAAHPMCPGTNAAGSSKRRAARVRRPKPEAPARGSACCRTRRLRKTTPRGWRSATPEGGLDVGGGVEP